MHYCTPSSPLTPYFFSSIGFSLLQANPHHRLIIKFRSIVEYYYLIFHYTTLRRSWRPHVDSIVRENNPSTGIFIIWKVKPRSHAGVAAASRECLFVDSDYSICYMYWRGTAYAMCIGGAQHMLYVLEGHSVCYMYWSYIVFFRTFNKRRSSCLHFIFGKSSLQSTVLSLVMTCKMNFVGRKSRQAKRDGMLG